MLEHYRRHGRTATTLHITDHTGSYLGGLSTNFADGDLAVVTAYLDHSLYELRSHLYDQLHPAANTREQVATGVLPPLVL